MIGILRWKPSVRASSFYALRCLLENRSLRDQPLDLLMSPVARRIQTIKLPDSAWRYIIPLSTRVESDFALATTVVQEMRDSGQSSTLSHEQLLQMLRECQQAMTDLHPNLQEELRLRVRPLREQWEARGPGLMAAVARRTDARIAETQADAVLVHPASGGGGSAYAAYNIVVIEAVLANPFAELPEVSRLGWFVSQIGALACLDEPHDDELRLKVSLALIPACLEASEEVELCRSDPRTIELALRTWLPHMPNSASRADSIHRWWQDQKSRPLSWVSIGSSWDEILS